MHGLGNDFVMVKDSDLAALFGPEKIAERGEHKSDPAALTAALSALARSICDRRTGVGADGLIVAVQLPLRYSVFQELIETYPSYSECSLAWIYINSDGSSSDMCGNGLRCLAYFAESEALLPACIGATFSIATRAYAVDVNLSAPAGGGIENTRTVSTTLAAPAFGTTKSNSEKTVALALGDITIGAVAVDLGNPHCVVFDCPELDLAQYQGCMQGICTTANTAAAHPSLEKFPPRLLELAHQIQSLPLFPQGVNVEFVLPQGKNRAVVYVVERGCGPTLACASGAAAVVAAGAIEGHLNRQCCVILPGGELEVAWSSVDNRIELSGPAQIVFKGEFPVSGASFFAPHFPVTAPCFEELPA